MKLLLICTLILIAESFALQLPGSLVASKTLRKNDTPTRYILDPARLPENTFVLDTAPRVTLTCGVVADSVGHRVQWTEFTTGTGRVISDSTFILPGHPEALRYSIIHDDDFGYDLQISPVFMSDGGTYLCDDTTANAATKKFHSASLTVGSSAYNCSTTIRLSGVIIDGQYHSNECQINYKGGLIPNTTWIGPEPFAQIIATTDSTIFIGMYFNATRDMNERQHIVELYFTDYFLPVDANSASNVPTFRSLYLGPQMFIYWGPASITASPIKPVYEVGDVLTCQADAFPAPSYVWQNLRTTEIFNNQQLIIPANWLGTNQTMRCEARNIIEGAQYTNNYFLNVDVQEVTDPPTTVAPPTSSDYPPVSPCTDLTGGWKSVTPLVASLCIQLDLNQNGALTGLFMNDTDSIWLDIVGRAEADKFDQVGFNGLWPYRTGVSSFVGECHRCNGEESLLVDVASRSKGSPCGTPGPVIYNDKYTFKRSTSLQCRNLPVTM